MSSKDFLDEENIQPEKHSNIEYFLGSYQVYLLRLWQPNQDGELVWRASLEKAHTGVRYGFADLDEHTNS